MILIYGIFKIHSFFRKKKMIKKHFGNHQVLWLTFGQVEVRNNGYTFLVGPLRIRHRFLSNEGIAYYLLGTQRIIIVVTKR